MTTDISRRTERFNALTNRYRVERELGAGGMATVYLGELRRRAEGEASAVT